MCDAHHTLKYKQLKLNALSGKTPAKGVFNITLRRGVANICIHTHAPGNVLHWLYRKKAAYTYQPPSARMAIRLLVSNPRI